MHLLFKYFVICVLDSFFQDTVVCRLANSFLEFALQLWKLRRHGDGSTGKCFCVCVCVYDSKGGAAQITITTVCVCVSVCVDVQKFATGSGWGLSTEKITVEVSQRFRKEYMSFINSFLLYLIDDSLILICVFTSRLAMLLPFTAIHKILKMDTLRVTKFTKIPN